MSVLIVLSVLWVVLCAAKVLGLEVDFLLVVVRPVLVLDLPAGDTPVARGFPRHIKPTAQSISPW